MPRKSLRIAILEDDEILIKYYELVFGAAGHFLVFQRTVADFIQALPALTFDVIILDWSLPDGNAERALRYIRDEAGLSLPVVIVSANDDESHIVSALKMGADDYLIKPVRPLEMIARIDALARQHHTSKSFQLGPYVVLPDERTIRINQSDIGLTGKEFDLALVLLHAPNALVSRAQMLNEVWNTSAELDTRTVDAHISRLRKKLELDGRHGWSIESVYGYGYRLRGGPIEGAAG
jgi:DNA-binding response OmpR family regulator